MAPVSAHRRPVDEDESRRANGPDWDRYADEYQATHGEFLGDIGFVWGPEGLTEEEAGLLGPQKTMSNDVEANGRWVAVPSTDGTLTPVSTSMRRECWSCRCERSRPMGRPP